MVQTTPKLENNTFGMNYNIYCFSQSCQPCATKKRNQNDKKKEFPTKKRNMSIRTLKPRATIIIP